MEKHLSNYICYVEQGVFPEMLVALKRCKTGAEMQEWMDSLGDYLSDFKRMQSFKPPEPKTEPKEEDKVEVPIQAVKMVEPDNSADAKPDEAVEDSMQERIWKYIKLLDNELRVAAFDEEQ